jgi:hypothetical protein
MFTSDGVTYSGVWGCLLCYGIWWGTGSGWVRYMKAGGVLKGLGVLFTEDKTDWL